MTAPLAPGPRCPVCLARFRATQQCSRCGAELAPLMRLSFQSYRLRQEARQAVVGGDFQRAQNLARTAQESAFSEAGGQLDTLTRWLVSVFPPGVAPAEYESSPGMRQYLPVVVRGFVRKFRETSSFGRVRTSFSNIIKSRSGPTSPRKDEHGRGP